MGVSDTNERNLESSASASKWAHCSSLTASSARNRLRRSLTSMRRRCSKVRGIELRSLRGGAGCGTVLPMSSPHAIFTPDHEELRAVVRRFVDQEVRPNVDEWERAGRFPDALFRRCGELGFLGLHYAARWGGSDGDLASGLLFVEELARCGAGAIPMAISVQSHMATPALSEFGTDAQRARWLVPAITGEKIGAIAITEPDAGSDVAAIQTRAVRDGDTWRVNGRKMFITNGVRADFLTLVAKTDPDGGHRGISLFIVDTNLPGVSVSRQLEKLGMHSSDTAEIALDDVIVPRSDLIGLEPGQGFAQLMWQLQYERLAGAAASVGHATQVLEDTIAYARERETFGRPIAQHQVIAHKLADTATELEAAARTPLLHRLARDARRVSRYGDLDDEEILRAGTEPFGRRVPPGVRRRGLPRGDAGHARVPRRASPTHRRRHGRNHERSHRETVRARTRHIGISAGIRPAGLSATIRSPCSWSRICQAQSRSSIASTTVAPRLSDSSTDTGARSASGHITNSKRGMAPALRCDTA